MCRNVILLVGPTSNNKMTHGMSIAFDMLISGLDVEEVNVKIIDRSVGERFRRVGAFSFIGIITTLISIIHYYVNLPFINSVYIALGTSRAGFFRDALMIWPAFIMGRRVVVHLHGGGYKNFYESGPSWLRKIIRYMFNKVDVFIVLGRLLRDQFDFVDGIDKKIRIVPNGFPLDFQNPNPKTISKDEPLRILYLSNLIPSKGYLDVLEACRILVQKRKIPVRCDFCGAFVKTVTEKEERFHDKTSFLKLIHGLNLQDFVNYHGTVRGDQKLNFLHKGNVFVLPTYYPWEGQPISIIEALAHGMPVISTSYRGIPEQVIDGYNGFFVPPQSPQKISSVIERLWQNPMLYKEMSKNALKHFEENFTKKAHLDRLIPIIMDED